MARKLPADAVGTPVKGSTSAAKEAADELQVMRPDVPLTLAGRELVVREYTFWESMDVVYAEPAFLDAVIDLLTGSDRDPWEAIRSLFGRFQSFLKSAAATSAGVEAEWIDTLRPRDVDVLMSTWWAVNGHFFLHEAAVKLRGRRTKAELSAGPTSSPASPAPDSATPTASGGTPEGN